MGLRTLTIERDTWWRGEEAAKAPEGTHTLMGLVLTRIGFNAEQVAALEKAAATAEEGPLTEEKDRETTITECLALAGFDVTFTGRGGPDGLDLNYGTCGECGADLDLDGDCTDNCDDAGDDYDDDND